MAPNVSHSLLILSNLSWGQKIFAPCCKLHLHFLSNLFSGIYFSPRTFDITIPFSRVTHWEAPSRQKLANQLDRHVVIGAATNSLKPHLPPTYINKLTAILLAHDSFSLAGAQLAREFEFYFWSKCFFRDCLWLGGGQWRPIERHLSRLWTILSKSFLNQSCNGGTDIM